MEVISMGIKRTLVLIAGIAAVAGCNRATSRSATTEDRAARTAEQNDQALVRVIHAIPQAPESDVYTNETKAFGDVKFGTATDYKPVPQTEFKISLKPSNQPEGPVMIEAKEGIDAGRRYTILAMPDRDGAAKLDTVTDEANAPSPGKAMVRVINVAPEAGAADVLGAQKDPIIDDVDYGSPAIYHEVDATDVKVRVEPKPAGAKTAKTRAAAFEEATPLEAGKAYTLVVAPGAEPGQPVRLIKVEDPITGAAASNDRGMIGNETAPAPKVDGNQDFEIKPDLEDLRERQQGSPRDTAKQK
jgi:hypothetical protein